MSKDDLDSHIEDIINALKDSKKEISKEEVEEELNKFMEYGVPIAQAKQTLIKKYGGSVVFTSTSGGRTLISDLEPNRSSVNLLGHVLAINPKEVTVKGENRKIFYGILEDESGSVPFTSWNELDVEKGDVVEISNAYTREWQGSVQLNLGDRVKVEKTDKDKLPKSAFEPKEAKVKDLRSGMGRVEVIARILDINEREAEVNGEVKKVFSGVIGDETGKAQFTSWHDFNIKKDDVLKISGGYVKSWKGIPQLTFDANVKVTKMEKSELSKEKIEFNHMPLHLLVEKQGALDVQVEGTVLEIRPGSGFILRCPECNRVLQNGECSIHGRVEGEPDLRVKLVLDDGTGAVSSVLSRKLTEQILGIKLDEAKKMKDDELMDLIHDKLFTKTLLLRGNALGDSFGTQIIAKDVKSVETNIPEEAEKLSKELEGLL